MSALILWFIDSLCFVESSISHQGERKKNLLPLHHPPHQPRKHLPWPILHKLRHAVGEHMLHALRPVDGASIIIYLTSINQSFIPIILPYQKTSIEIKTSFPLFHSTTVFGKIPWLPPTPSSPQLLKTTCQALFNIQC